MTAIVQERNSLHFDECENLSESQTYESQDSKVNADPRDLSMSSLYDDDDDIFEDAENDDECSTSSSLSSFVSAEDEIDADVELGSVVYPRRVSWSPAVVTDVQYRPRTSPEDKLLLHYTAADLAMFKQQYKMQLRATLKLKRESERRQKEQEEAAPSTNYQNPLSGLVNMMSSYLSTSSSSTQTREARPASATGIVDTTLLVDTLYLF